MKKSKIKKIILLLYLIITLLLGTYFIIKIISIPNINEKFLLLEYSYGGGYGTYGQTVTKTIRIDKEGIVELITNDTTQDAPKERFTIDKQNLENLNKVIKSSNLLLIGSYNKQKEDDCLDGSSSNLKIYFDNSEYIYKSNSCSRTKAETKVINKILEIVSEEKLDKFEEKIEEYYDNKDY